MKDKRELAYELGTTLQYLSYILYKIGTEYSYHTFSIPKKDGSYRTIHSPSKSLKALQKKLSNLLYKKQEEIWRELDTPPNISHGFHKNRSILTNASVHRNKRYLLNLDLQNFFESFHFGRVRGYFHKNKHFNCSLEVATALAQLSCYNGSLPQGAPSSPVITNLICQIMDYRILKIAKKYRLDYSRYADDLSFSTNDRHFLNYFDAFFEELKKEIVSSGFAINEDKTRLAFRDSKQVVTGLVVNKRISVDKDFFRKTRAMAHSLYTKGHYYIDSLSAHSSKTEKGSKTKNEEGDTILPLGSIESLSPLEGRLSFIDLVDTYNDPSTNANHFELNAHGREYQRFLFYKHFWSREQALIITEGKTDILILMAALKNLNEDYPELIERKEGGSFEYLVDFLGGEAKANKRGGSKNTSKLKRFFAVSAEGGSSMENVYNYYFGGKKKFSCPSYAEIFDNYGSKPASPVFLLFDNELTNKKKPLSNFRGYRELDESEQQSFIKTHITKLNKTLKRENEEERTIASNLFLLTIPLVDNKKECEIEDLFSEEVRNVKIEGRSFKPDVKVEDKGFYSKEVFAQYVYNNYERIDFSNFKVLLDNIRNTIVSYSGLDRV